ncbi:MAG TPA: hypothetical protein VHL58_01915 [Thermoanaerobaculia bacterium]|nr:hypothetical protein [Thermoanaerobaculia bacterium]
MREACHPERQRRIFGDITTVFIDDLARVTKDPSVALTLSWSFVSRVLSQDDNVPNPA